MTEISLLRLFKLRAAVGRFGEMDAAGWWNTQGVLGPRGAAVYKRGLPRTHFFARVRLVSSVAWERSSSVYPAPGVATLWDLPPQTERALAFQERKWPANGVDSAGWTSFETALAAPPADDLVGWLTDLDLVSADLAARVTSLPMAPGGKGTEVPGPITDEAVQLLALAHAKSGPRNLVVPFVSGGLEVAGG